MSTVSDVRKEPGVSASPSREEGRDPSTTPSAQSEHRAGEPRSLLAIRLLAAGALLVTGLIHAKLAAPPSLPE